MSPASAASRPASTSGPPTSTPTPTFATWSTAASPTRLRPTNRRQSGPTGGAIGQVGYIDVHQPTGTVYVSGWTGQVCHSTLTLLDGTPSGYECRQAASGSVANIFFVVKVAEDGTPNGTVYVTYSDTHDIFLAHSLDKGVTWSQPV